MASMYAKQSKLTGVGGICMGVCMRASPFCPKCSSPSETGFSKLCKQCAAEKARLWRKNNRAKNTAIVRAYRDRNKGKMQAFWRRMSLKKRYGITPLQFDELLAAQKGKCAICGTDRPGGPGNRFAVDHNHSTGAVRGLLCCQCNFTVGYSRESIAILTNAAEYLKKWEPCLQS